MILLLPHLLARSDSTDDLLQCLGGGGESLGRLGVSVLEEAEGDHLVVCDQGIGGILREVRKVPGGLGTLVARLGMPEDFLVSQATMVSEVLPPVYSLGGVAVMKTPPLLTWATPSLKNFSVG